MIGDDVISDHDVLAARPPKNAVDVWRPYAFFVEPECQADGRVEDVATLFLTNRECPLRCTMCDLWKNTTDETVPVGAIPAQIEYALARLPSAKHVKLYNSGNFFDPQAIPPADYPAIAARVGDFRTVIVENHPRFCGDRVLHWRKMLPQSAELEVAIGLETIHPEVLPRLNKRMTIDDFARVCDWLGSNGIALRAFVLLRPPYLSDDEAIEWAVRSIEFAFHRGVRAVSVIPTRAGNGLMERLAVQGQFSPPTLEAFESVFDQGLALRRGRVFVDLWDIQQLATGQPAAADRIERLRRMNLSQRIEDRVA